MSRLLISIPEKEALLFAPALPGCWMELSYPISVPSGTRATPFGVTTKRRRSA